MRETLPDNFTDAMVRDAAIEIMAHPRLDNSALEYDVAKAVNAMDAQEGSKFNNWANGSVVTIDGKPYPQGSLSVMWHGTNHSFDYFDYEDMGNVSNLESSIGFHFGTKFAAENRAGIGSRLIPVILSVRNPIRVPDIISFVDSNHEFKDSIIKSVTKDKIMNEEEGWDIEEEDEGIEYGFGQLSKVGEFVKKVQDTNSTEELRGVLIDYGYDGIVYENTQEELNRAGHDSLIVFCPSQIRNAETLKPMWKNYE